MAENAGPSTEEVAEDEEENFNYYDCKYLFFRFGLHQSANLIGWRWKTRRKKKKKIERKYRK